MDKIHFGCVSQEHMPSTVTANSQLIPAAPKRRKQRFPDNLNGDTLLRHVGSEVTKLGVHSKALTSLCGYIHIGPPEDSGLLATLTPMAIYL